MNIDISLQFSYFAHSGSSQPVVLHWKKETPEHVFSCKMLVIFLGQIFQRTVWTGATATFQKNGFITQTFYN